MASIYYLSEQDAQLLQAMFADYRKRVGNTTGRGRRDGIEDEEHQAPEVYIARVPEDGIPALDENVTGTGTGPPLDDVFSSTDCAIYQLIEDGSGQATPELVGLSKRVYNLSATAIAGDQWLPVVRDKFGIWVPAGQFFLDGFTGTHRVVVDVECVGNALTVTWDTLTYEDGRVISIAYNT